VAFRTSRSAAGKRTLDLPSFWVKIPEDFVSSFPSRSRLASGTSSRPGQLGAPGCPSRRRQVPNKQKEVVR
jgi:hypothetical protein